MGHYLSGIDGHCLRRRLTDMTNGTLIAILVAREDLVVVSLLEKHVVARVCMCRQALRLVNFGGHYVPPRQASF